MTAIVVKFASCIRYEVFETSAGRLSISIDNSLQNTNAADALLVSFRKIGLTNLTWSINNDRKLCQYKFDFLLQNVIVLEL